MTESLPQRASCFVLSSDDESRLVTEAQRDPAEFVALYNLFVTSIYRYLLSRVGDTKDAEDLTSQVFLSAFENLPRYQHRGNFAAWLFAIARNKAADFFRYRISKSRTDKVKQDARENDLLSIMMHDEEISRLKQLMLQLPAEAQELIRLRFVAELTFPQIAVVLHKQEETVKKQLYRLLARLQRRMEDDRERKGPISTI